MKTERVLVCLFVIAYVMKFLHMGEAGLFMVLITGVLSVIYLFGSFYFFSDESIKRQNRTFSVIAGVLLAMVPQTILQKVQYWPDAQWYLGMGIVLSLLVFIIAYLLRNKKEELKQYYRNMLYAPARCWACVYCSFRYLQVPWFTGNTGTIKSLQI